MHASHITCEYYILVFMFLWAILSVVNHKNGIGEGNNRYPDRKNWFGNYLLIFKPTDVEVVTLNLITTLEQNCICQDT